MESKKSGFAWTRGNQIKQLPENVVMPTLNEIVNDLNSAELISKHDLTSGYHYLELDEDSRYITTFSTHVRFYHIQKAEFRNILGI